MKVRKIRCKNDLFEPLDFNKDSVIIKGGNGAGKSLVCRVICEAFKPAVTKNIQSSLEGDWTVEFEVGAEIGAVSIRNGKIDSLGLLKKYISLEEKVNNCVVVYGSSRSMGPESFCGGIRSSYAILHDLHMRQVSNSVIIIDDFDLGLTLPNQEKLFKHLRKNYAAKNCQLIITVKEWTLDLLESQVIDLSNQIDVISDTIKLLGKF